MIFRVALNIRPLYSPMIVRYKHKLMQENKQKHNIQPLSLLK